MEAWVVCLWHQHTTARVRALMSVLLCKRARRSHCRTMVVDRQGASSSLTQARQDFKVTQHDLGQQQHPQGQQQRRQHHHPPLLLESVGEKNRIQVIIGSSVILGNRGTIVWGVLS